MPDQLGHVTFPGIAQVRSCTYTRGLGTLPDVFHMQVVPQEGAILSKGALEMSFNGVTVKFPDCQVDRATLRMSTAQGHFVNLKMFDRRWEWRCKLISGYYNARFADGSIQDGTERTPQQLATLLLQAMGEFGFSVSNLPDTDRPTVDWDFATAATELRRLCERRGCVVSLDLDNRVRIYRVGQGPSLPDTDIRSVGFGVNPPEPPNQILVIGGKVIVQSKLLLEAVGLDLDGYIKLIDDLSYTPTIGTAGWADETPEMTNVKLEFGDIAQRLAKRTVWKWYRVKAQSDGSLDIPGYTGDVTGLWQILPIRDRKVDTTPDVDDIERSQPATVEGVHFVLELQGNTAATEQVESVFSIDKELGIVKFLDPVFMKDTDDGLRDPATLYLETSYFVQNAVTRRFENLVLSPGNCIQPIRRDDIYQVVIAEYSPTDPTVLKDITTNLTEANTEADANLTAVALNYQTGLTVNVDYRGIQYISTNGANRQVTWTIDINRGFSTQVFRNNESQYGVLTQTERRRIEYLRDEQERSDRIDDVRWENQ
jgi:hypothetical protein